MGLDVADFRDRLPKDMSGGQQLVSENEQNMSMRQSPRLPLHSANIRFHGSKNLTLHNIFDELPHLDGKHVVFGKVVEGMGIVTQVERCGSRDGKTSRRCTISDCGVL